MSDPTTPPEPPATSPRESERPSAAPEPVESSPFPPHDLDVLPLSDNPGGEVSTLDLSDG